MITLKILKKKADDAYCNYLRQLRKPECLGWEAKVKSGKFGKAELDAHRKAYQFFGKHQGLLEAFKLLEAP